MKNISVMNRALIFSITVIVIALLSCSDKVVTEKSTEQWLITPDELYLRDEPGQIILPIIYPDLEFTFQVVEVYNSETVIGVTIDGQYRAYPIPILRWREVVNDMIDNDYFSVVYCPLTGAGMAWSREDSITLGSANLVYNSGHLVNIFQVDNYWLPMTQQCVYGPRIGERSPNLPYIETSWQTWKEMYPMSKTLTRDYDFQYDYGDDPYPQYSVDDGMILYPVNHEDSRMQTKDKVYTIIYDGGAKAYPLTSFTDSVALITDNIDGRPIIIAGTRGKRLTVSFYNMLNETTELSFQPIQESLPAIMTDDRGNTWDVFGTAISGPDAGSRLEACRAYNAYWFAVAAVYPDVEIYQP